MIYKKVYAAKEYRQTPENNYRIPNIIEINNPENLPTLPQDDGSTSISLTQSYFKNTNYPIGKNSINNYNSEGIPISNTSFRFLTYIPKRMPFMLISQTDRVEDGVLFLI